MPQDNFILNGAQSVTEDLSFFMGGIVGCGEASALVISHILTGQKIDPTEVTNLIKAAANAGKLNSAGHGQTAQDVQWDLSQFGISSKIVGWNSGDTQSMFQQIDDALSAGLPVEVGVSTGSALSGEQSNLQGHYITLVGLNGGNFVAADPNSAQSKTGGFVNETPAQLKNANPFALIIPTGKGVGTTNTQDTTGGGNPLDIAGAISGLGSALSSGIGAGIGAALKTLIMAPFNAIGINSVSDLGWRALLIAMAIILFLIGLTALIFDFLKSQDVEVAGTKV